MSKSLVADYESSSSEEELASPDLSCKKSGALPLTSALEMLDENAGSISSSVFTNPYREAENYEQSLLERHVKMTTVKDPKLADDKKICFKFHKGKCKLGDKCRFLHHNPFQVSNIDNNLSDSEDKPLAICKQEKAKRKCGLTDNLVPPKKYMKAYSKSKQNL